jgi:hypothetical protein
MAIATLAITTTITVVGLYLAHSLRRHQRLKVADQRMTAYSSLWQIMELARPIRLETWDDAGALRRGEARLLCDQMTTWYYESGNGMVLTNDTKNMYVLAKKKLGRYSIAVDLAWEHEGKQLIRDLSLLRTQMKRDLNIYGVFYFGDDRSEEDEAFLRDVGFNPKTWARPPWYRRIVSRLRASHRAGSLDA